MDDGWGAVTRIAQAPSSGTPSIGVDAELIRLLESVLAKLDHSEATATVWDTHAVAATTNNPVLVSGANPQRIAVAVQLSSAVVAYMGPDNTVSAVASSIGAGYLLPVGGGFLFGPENTLDVWVVHANPATQDIRVLELWRARNRDR